MPERGVFVSCHRRLSIDLHATLPGSKVMLGSPRYSDEHQQSPDLHAVRPCRAVVQGLLAFSRLHRRAWTLAAFIPFVEFSPKSFHCKRFHSHPFSKPFYVFSSSSVVLVRRLNILLVPDIVSMSSERASGISSDVFGGWCCPWRFASCVHGDYCLDRDPILTSELRHHLPMLDVPVPTPPARNASPTSSAGY